MNYDVPDEVNFFEEGFRLSKSNDPDEGIFSFEKSYEGKKELIFTHSPCYSDLFKIKSYESPGL